MESSGFADTGNNSDAVKNDEVLYRRVPNESLYYVRDPVSGINRPNSAAFSDRRFRPSVDRATLRGFAPQKTQITDADGVASITALQVRQLQFSHGAPVTTEYVADVEPVPVADNPAHAEIFARPTIYTETKNAFRKLAERLAREAKAWEIPPADLRMPTP